MDLWERGLHAGLVRDAKAEGAAREGRASSDGKEEEEAVARSYHNIVFSSKIRKAVHWETDKEGGGGVFSWMTNARKPGDQLQRFSRKIIRACVCPPWKTPCE